MPVLVQMPKEPSRRFLTVPLKGAFADQWKSSEYRVEGMAGPQTEFLFISHIVY